MIGCWQEGELRAYLDGELPAGDISRLGAHLQTCAPCRDLCAHLERRAEWVGSQMGALAMQEAPLLGTSPFRGRGSLPAKEPRAVASGALAVLTAAAAVVLALVLLPRGGKEPVTFAPPPKAAVPTAPASPAPVTVKPAIIRRIVPRKKAAPTIRPRLEYFLALDDEPVEAGMVVRVALGDGGVPADVIVGTDGEAHAIRLVSSGTGDR
jgi:hypothetical protein